jgi:hypothetical protein
MRDHLCQILAHYVLYLGWRLNLPIPHDAEPFILKDAAFQWHKEGLFQWEATAEDEAEESFNSTGLDTGFSPEMPPPSPSNFESDAQTWSTHATSSWERFYTRPNIAPISIVDPPDLNLVHLTTCQSAQASNEYAFAQPQQPLLRISPLGHDSCSATSPSTRQDPPITIIPRNHLAISHTEVPHWQWIENSRTISMDRFGLNDEEHMVVDVPLQATTNIFDAPNIPETAGPPKKLHGRGRYRCLHSASCKAYSGFRIKRKCVPWERTWEYVPEKCTMVQDFMGRLRKGFRNSHSWRAGEPAKNGKDRGFECGTPKVSHSWGVPSPPRMGRIEDLNVVPQGFPILGGFPARQEWEMGHEKNPADLPDSELLTAERMRTTKQYLLV